MEPRDDIREGGNANDPPPKVFASYVAPNVTPQKQRLVGIAADLLFPQKDASYPGRRKALLGRRISVATWKQWRSGTRKAPAWFRESLVRQLQQKIAAQQHVLALLVAELENEKS